MSLVTEILDRLSGVEIVRERLTDTGRKVERLAEAVLDHERRIVRLETSVFPFVTGTPRRLPKG